MWVGGVVEYMSDSWYWWCYHTEDQCGLIGLADYMSDSYCFHTESYLIWEDVVDILTNNILTNKFILYQ